MADEFGEKTEDPTDKKLQDAREKGNIPKSQEMNTVAGLIAAFLGLYLFGDDLVFQAKEYFVFVISQIHEPIPDMNRAVIVSDMLKKYASVFVAVSAPIILPIVLVGLLINVAQVGINLLMKPLEPNFSKLNPISGIKNLLSTKTLIDILKNIAKLIAVSVVVYLSLRNEVYLLPKLVDLSVWQIVVYISGLCMKVVFYIVLLFFCLAVFDMWFQRYNHNKQLKMTKQEVKEEARNQDGDPMIKGKIKQIQYEMAQRRMMEEVPEATVVVTNPTFLAIAIKYEEGMGTPTVVAKGMKAVAEKIRDIATENSIPIVENKPLARSMYSVVEPGDEIPVEFYEAIAEVIAYVYKLKKS